MPIATHRPSSASADRRFHTVLLFVLKTNVTTTKNAANANHFSCRRSSPRERR